MKRLKHIFVTSVLSVFSVSCATLANRKQVLSVDSEPRGLAVLSEDGDKLGTTPFFYEVARTHRLNLKIAGSQINNFSVNCRVRWTNVALSNVPFGVATTVFAVTPIQAVAFGVAAYSLGVGTDFIVGGAYDCPLTLMYREKSKVTSAPQKPQQAEPQCRTFLPFPPTASSEAISIQALREWTKAFKPKLGKCDRVVSEQATVDIFAKNNISFEKEFHPTKFDRARLYTMAHRLGATDLVVLRYDVSAAKSIRYLVYDAHTLAKSGEEKIPIANSANAERSVLQSFYSVALSLLPNSIATSPGTTKYVEPLPKPGFGITGKAEDTNKKLAAENTYRNLQLTNIAHPYKFDPWDYSFSLGPVVKFATLNNDIVLTTFETQEKWKYDFEVRYLLLQPFLNTTFHTPVGAFSGGSGFGPGWVSFKDKWSETRSYHWFLSIQTAYTAFVTENIFTRIDANYYLSSKEHLRIPYIASKKWVEGAISVGYFVPGLKAFF